MGQQPNTSSDNTKAFLAALVAVIFIVTLAAVSLSITEKGSTTTLLVLVSLFTPIVTGLMALLGGKTISKVMSNTAQAVSKTDEANEKLDTISHAVNGKMADQFELIHRRLTAIERHIGLKPWND